jgi:hypothetical protein
LGIEQLDRLKEGVGMLAGLPSAPMTRKSEGKQQQDQPFSVYQQDSPLPTDCATRMPNIPA